MAVVLAHAPPAAAGMGQPRVAALQVALRAKGVYAGDIDGWNGPQTRRAVRALQRQAGIGVDGIPGPVTLRALGRRGRPALRSRNLGAGASGFDVAQLQFLLAWHGFPSGPIDGGFGSRTQAAVMRFQRWARMRPDGIAGRATLGALVGPPPRSPLGFGRPVSAPTSDAFGPRGNRFHTGVDFPAATGARVVAAGGGRIVSAGWRSDGYGNTVTIAHGNGLRSMYAHLSRTLVRRGARIAAGTPVGLVGATGTATGPHLHFEVRLRDAALDPYWR